MVQAVQTPETTYAPAEGAVGPFATVFTYETAAEVAVSLVDADGAVTALASGDDYSLAAISGDALVNGGNVTLADGVAADTHVFLSRLTPASQPQEFGDTSAYSPVSAMLGLDRQARVSQELRARVARDVSVPPGEGGLLLPSIAARRGKLAYFADTASAPVVGLSLEGLQALVGQAFKGDPGGEVLAIGLATAIPALNIPLGVDLIQTVGYAVRGKGAARYVLDDDQVAGAGATRARFLSANGRWFRLLTEIFIDAAQVGVLADGATDDAQALAFAKDLMLSSGAGLVLPVGVIKTTQALTIGVDDFFSYMDAFGAGPRIFGMGQGRTIIDSRVAGAAWFSLDTANPHTDPFDGVLGGELSGLTILNGAATAVSSGIELRTTYQFCLRAIHVFGLSGAGIKVTCIVGDQDASNMVTLSDIRVDQCAGWGVDLAAEDPYNETSHLTLDNVFIQNCGTDETKAITGITQANPAVVTAAGHGFVNGQTVYLMGVGGMTHADSFVAKTRFTVAGATTNTFQLSGVDSTGFAAFTSGGRAMRTDPSSGGLHWKGQVLRARNLGLPLNRNVSLYIEGQGAGIPADVDLRGVGFENFRTLGLLANGILNLRCEISHFYVHGGFAGGPVYAGVVLDGSANTISHAVFDQCRTRSGRPEDTTYTGYVLMGDNAERQTCRVTRSQWENRQTGQRHIVGFLPPAEVRRPECQLVAEAADSLSLAPLTGVGDTVPIRLRGDADATGEWICHRITSAIVAADPAGGLTPSTAHNVYVWDDANVRRLEVVERGGTGDDPVVDADSGLLVKPGDASRAWVGGVMSNGAGNFSTTGNGFLNALRLPGTQSSGYMWTDSTGDLRFSATRPTSDTGGTVVGTQS